MTTPQRLTDQVSWLNHAHISDNLLNQSLPQGLHHPQVQMEEEIKEVLGDFTGIFIWILRQIFFKIKSSTTPWQVSYSVSGSAFLNAI